MQNFADVETSNNNSTLVLGLREKNNILASFSVRSSFDTVSSFAFMSTKMCHNEALKRSEEKRIREIKAQ